MDGQSSSDKHSVLNLLIEEAEEHRDEQKTVVKREMRLGHDTTNAETVLREAKDILSVLRAQRKALEDEH